MAIQVFTNAQITDDRINYIYQEAMVLASRDQYSIENYMDREVNNPDVKEYLESQAELDGDSVQPTFTSRMLTLSFPL